MSVYVRVRVRLELEWDMMREDQAVLKDYVFRVQGLRKYSPILVRC